MYGKRLVVVIARDTQIQRIKKHAPHMHERDRLTLIRALRIVDTAYLGDPHYHYERLVKKIKPDTIVLGYDQKETAEEIWQRLALVGLKPKIVRLKAYRPAMYKSSKLCSISN